MTTQAIADFLTKQLFIERNIVTYRSLSRQFSIHVNVAKNELAIFHHNAPYQSQACRATFLLNGVPRAPAYDEDYDMEGTPNATQEEEGGDEVPQTQITIVNEADLEDAKASYEELISLHIYSLSPAPIHDAGLLCAPTEFVRSTDREKGPAFSIGLGRIATKGIKMGASKIKARPTAPVAGPSKLKMPEPKGGAAKAEPSKETTNAATEKGKEKPKPTGKLSFFSKPKEPVAKPIKTEETDSKKKLFFSRPAAPAKAAPEPPAPKAKEPTKPTSKDLEKAKEPPKAKVDEPEPARGVKRKSSIGLEPREKSPETVPTTSKAPPAAPETHRTKRRVVLSDDEDSEPVVSRPPARKVRPSFKTESAENSDAEREARALMDIDDDQVEKVSRVPSTNASSNELDDDDGGDASPGIQDEDVSMDEDAPKTKAKPKPRKPKAVIPVGRNGLKKKKVTKTRRRKDANGYMVKEDYSDWESVEEGDEAEAEPPKPPVKAKTKVTKVKKEESAEIEMSPPPMKEKAKKKEPAPTKKPTVRSAPKPKPPVKGAASAKGKSQQTLNFFGPKKT
ncbi:hypothetical protein HYPSUDRAFT_197528 [Hypholoma sublateritium FD-334 SS-4]|uniref:DNA polymerase delta subunit 3 n=1 Tax=Hypholoma sublateritium (strain FD-334 SS-4) TaxID=945553 RepID=A0A0D2PAM5_HYPSF|nr:hypothetical protein HYPSUDRAFT_197528 [Hypholoma sublateritium FD-334 SS-4]